MDLQDLHFLLLFHFTFILIEFSIFLINKYLVKTAL